MQFTQKLKKKITSDEKNRTGIPKARAKPKSASFSSPFCEKYTCNMIINRYVKIIFVIIIVIAVCYESGLSHPTLFISKFWGLRSLWSTLLL